MSVRVASQRQHALAFPYEARCRPAVLEAGQLQADELFRDRLTLHVEDRVACSVAADRGEELTQCLKDLVLFGAVRKQPRTGNRTSQREAVYWSLGSAVPR